MHDFDASTDGTSLAPALHPLADTCNSKSSARLMAMERWHISVPETRSVPFISVSLWNGHFKMWEAIAVRILVWFDRKLRNSIQIIVSDR